MKFDISFCNNSEACASRATCRRHMTQEMRQQLRDEGRLVSWIIGKPTVSGEKCECESFWAK